MIIYVFIVLIIIIYFVLMQPSTPEEGNITPETNAEPANAEPANTEHVDNPNPSNSEPDIAAPTYSSDLVKAANEETDGKLSAPIEISTTESFFMYGPWIGKYTPIDKISVSTDDNIYMFYDGKYTKMVNDKGIAKYYEGSTDKFSRGKWLTYSDAGDNYKLRKCDVKCGNNACDDKGTCYDDFKIVKDPSDVSSTDKYFIYGPWIGNYVAIDKISVSPNDNIYMIDDKAGSVKMVNDAGKGKYYKGKLDDFTRANWNSYSDAWDNYKLRKCPVKCGEKACDDKGVCFDDLKIVKNPSEVSTEEKYFIYGPWIGNYVAIDKISVSPNDNIYMIDDKAGSVKMVNDAGKGKYYKGKLDDFTRANWNSYSDAWDNYKLRKCPVKCGEKACDDKGVCFDDLKIVKNPSEVSTEEKYFMYGPWIGNYVPVDKISESPNDNIYMFDDKAGSVKMVNDAGKGKYYKGKLDDFTRANWNSYSDAWDNYKLRKCPKECDEKACDENKKCLGSTINWKGYKISTNGKCGPNADNTACPGEQCCSIHGWCGGKKGQNDAWCGNRMSNGIYDGQSP